MPTVPIVDFRETDLSRTVFGIDEIRAAIKQRGQFEMLDAVTLFCPERELIVGHKEVRADDWWAPFHIPGRPLFPGALMVEAAAQLCSVYYHHVTENDDSFVGFGGIDKARFRAPVEPDCRLVIGCKLTRRRRSMFGFEAQGFVDQKLVFEAEILGVLL